MTIIKYIERYMVEKLEMLMLYLCYIAGLTSEKLAEEFAV